MPQRAIYPGSFDPVTYGHLDIIKRAKGIAILAHPAVDHKNISYEDFDRAVLDPLIKEGLDGVEILYPYDLNYRTEANQRYTRIAKEKGMLMSGGTDYHGDGRTGLADVKLSMENLKKILNYNH